MAFKDAIGPTGLKMSQLRTKQKPSGKGGGKEFPSMEATNFFDPKSLGMSPARGSNLPRRKAAPLEMDFNSVPGPPQKKKPPSNLRKVPMRGADKDPFEVY
jgi:hypothetical protein